MLRRSVYTFRKILQPVVCYSTSTSNKKNQSTPLIMKLMSEFDSVWFITHALQNKELSSIHFDAWKSRIYLLKSHQFTDAECFKMISAYPHLLKIPLEDFENSLQQWRNVGDSFANFQYLLLNQPLLIDIKIKDIRKRVPQLQVYFKSSKSLCELLIASPNVMFDNLNTLVEKLNYLVKIRKFSMGDIISSQALSKPLYFIKFRIELLEKCGIYKQDDSPVHKKNRYDKTKHQNPSLKRIIDPDGKSFIKVAKISHEEYAICKDLLLKQDDYDENEDDEEDEKGGYQ